MHEFISRFSVLFQRSTYVFMPVTCCSYYYSFVIWFDIEKYDVCSFVSLSQDCFDYLGSFVVPYIFRIQLFTSEYIQGNKITISSRYLHCYLHAQSLSCVWLFATTRVVARQASLSMGFSQARMLEWITISSSRGIFWPRDRTHVSSVPCIGRQILYHWATWEAHSYIHSSTTHIIHNNHDMKTTQESVDGWMEKIWCTHTLNVIFSAIERRKSCYLWQYGWT